MILPCYILFSKHDVKQLVHNIYINIQASSEMFWTLFWRSLDISMKTLEMGKLNISQYYIFCKHSMSETIAK